MRRLSVSLAAACVVSLAFTGPAAAAGPPTLVSHGDPFAGCVGVGADPTAMPPGLNFPSAEVEPWVADNLRNPRNVVGTWQQDRWTDGGARGLVAGWSFDRGRTWGQTPMPFSLCAAPFYGGNVSQYDRASDPWNSFGPDGKAYSVGLVFNANNNNNGVSAATSTDGGRTWQNLRQLIVDLDSDPTVPVDDKESVTADPTHAGVAYAVWDRLQNVACGPAAAARPRVDDRPFTRDPQPALLCFTGPTYFTRTTDGGRSWETARVIVPTPVNEQTIGNVIVVNRQTGVLFDFFAYITADGLLHGQMIYSQDQGVTWSQRQAVGEIESLAATRGVGVVDPRTGDPLRTGDIIPEPAIDPRTGQLYLAWQDARFNSAANDQLVIATSRDPLGRTGTWSAPRLVNPAGDPAAFTPAITVNHDSQVAIGFYDFRHLDRAPNSILPTDTWVRVFEGGSLELENEFHIGGPFNMRAAPVARGFFTGDYEGMTADEATGGFVPFWVQTNCADTSCTAVGNETGAPTGTPDPTNVFATRVPGGEDNGS